MSEKKYPDWLNIASGVALLLLVVGLLLIIFSVRPHGYLVMAAGFLGVWICGALAEKHRTPEGEG